MLTNAENEIWKQLIEQYINTNNEHSMVPIQIKPILLSLEGKGYLAIGKTMPGYVMIKLLKVKKVE